ncbi:F-box protein At3g07870-like [Macadamia integrifolia]|uniref:F-box protein At3g07870-like n=1 Tax=Macadamia integrifolia TaxID=60698 RepID=UPI001C4FFD2E|nr:F-box protein At3g07870-like [Macadamia integrifolia]
MGIGYSNGGGSSAKLEDLDLDVIIEIFSRLPADTLIRLRSVCKLWNNLIRDPVFIDLHLKKLMQTPPSQVILALDTSFKNTRRGLFLVDGVEEYQWRAREIQVEYLQDNRLDVVGSCNGLVCMAPTNHFDSIFICNPITGECLCLPESNLIADGLISFRSLFVSRIGFGYDHVAKKYKVIRFLYDERKLVGEINTLGESSWRKLDFSVNREGWFGLNSSKALFLNGFLYWMIKRVPDELLSGDEFILAFDICSENFCIIDFPPPLSEPIYELQLINIKGSLAIAIENYDQNFGLVISRIWRLVGSMAVGFSLEQCSYDISCHQQYNKRYALLSDGTLLLKRRRCGRFVRFTPYHSKQKHMTGTGKMSFTEKNLSVSQMCEPYLFTPSLVSLNDTGVSFF